MYKLMFIFMLVVAGQCDADEAEPKQNESKVVSGILKRPELSLKIVDVNAVADRKDLASSNLGHGLESKKHVEVSNDFGCSFWGWIPNVNQFFLTVIAVCGLIITYSQWQLNKNKTRFELYDRRLKIYEEVNEIARLLRAELDVPLNEWLGFMEKLRGAYFLFGKDVWSYTDEINGLISGFLKKKRQLEGVSPSPERTELVGKQYEILEKLEKQLEVEMIRKTFKKYLDFSKL